MKTLKQRRYCLIAFLLMLSLGTIACKGNAQKEDVPQKVEAVAAPVITAVEPDFDFGKAKQGSEVSHIYKIKNTGTKELVIEKTHGS